MDVEFGALRMLLILTCALLPKSGMFIVVENDERPFSDSDSPYIV